MKVKLLKKFRKLIDYDVNAFDGFGIDDEHQRKFDRSYVSSIHLALTYDVEKLIGRKMSMVFIDHPASVEAIRKFFKDYEKYRRRYWLPSEKLRRAIANGDCR